MTNPNRERSAIGVRNYWARMTPEQRSAEMSRRQRVAQEKRLEKRGRGRPKGSASKPRLKPSWESPFPAKSTTGITIRERLIAIENAVAALKSDLGL